MNWPADIKRRSLVFRLTATFLVFSYVSFAHAGFQLAGGPFYAPAGLGGVRVYNLQYTNDTGSAQIVFRFELLDYSLSVAPYSNSGTSSVALLNNIVDVSATSWTEFGGGAAPLGSIGWASPFGLIIPAGGTTTIGTFEVTLPASFSGEYFLTSTDPLGVTVTTSAEVISGQGITLTNGLTRIGEPPAIFVIPLPNGNSVVFEL